MLIAENCETGVCFLNFHESLAGRENVGMVSYPHSLYDTNSHDYHDFYHRTDPRARVRQPLPCAGVCGRGVVRWLVAQVVGKAAVLCTAGGSWIL